MPVSLRGSVIHQCLDSPRPVWPDLAKFYHFGKSLKIFGYSSKFYFEMGKILNLIGIKVYEIGQILIAVNGSILKRLFSHLVTLPRPLFVFPKIDSLLQHLETVHFLSQYWQPGFELEIIRVLSYLITRLHQILYWKKFVLWPILQMFYFRKLRFVSTRKLPILWL